MIKFSPAAEVVSRGRREGGMEKKEEVGEKEEGLGREIQFSFGKRRATIIIFYPSTLLFHTP